MTSRFIDLDTNTVRETTDVEFFASIFGHPPRTREQKQAEWAAKVQRYVELILRGCELSEYGNMAVREAKELIASRAEKFTEVRGDPLLKRFG